MFVATSAGSLEIAREAAQAIVEKCDRIGDTQLVKFASKILDGASAEQITSPGSDFVKRARKVLSIDYSNPVLLMDVALALTSKGNDRAAFRYVRSAVAMAPASRFIVRSAARYFLHVGDPERAHSILRRSPLFAGDPWIQASEIAVESVRNRTSAIAKKSLRSLLDKRQIATDQTELASAIATIEHYSGSKKNAKRLFNLALSSPNDNSLAQAESLANLLRLVVDQAALSTPLSFEANSHNAYRHLQMEDALASAKRWELDEPFASRPVEFMTFLYSLLGRYQESATAAERGIELDGNKSLSPRLNILFANIKCGQIAGSVHDLQQIARLPGAKDHATHILANAGALAYATHDFDLARDFYRRAVSAAKVRGERETASRAHAFFARSAAESHDPQLDSILKDAIELVEQVPSPAATYVLQQLVAKPERYRLQQSAEARIAKREWHWDALANTLSLLEPK